MKENASFYNAVGVRAEDMPFTEKSNAIFKRIESWLCKLLECGSAVLEIGSGNGRLSFALERAGYNVVGIDVAEDPLAFAEDYAERNGYSARFFLADGEAFDLPYLFDGVLLLQNNVVEYNPQGLERMLNCAKAHLRVGGRLIIEMNDYVDEQVENADNITIPQKGIFIYKTYSHTTEGVEGIMASVFGYVGKSRADKRVVLWCDKG